MTVCLNKLAGGIFLSINWSNRYESVPETVTVCLYMLFMQLYTVSLL